jgi:glycosyltransferase involved in cell wall biosynthesis
MAHPDIDRAAGGVRPAASIVVRAKNEEALIGRTLDRLQSQTFRDYEIIVVDSGSTDRTLEIARGFPTVRLIEIRPEEFTFGRALNIGCRESRGEFLVFLSAHALPGSDRWLELLLAHFADERVVGVWGAQKRHPIDRRPPRVVRQDFAMFMNDIYFGFNNSNGAMRKATWEKYPLNEELPGSEDKEWAHRVLSEGYLLVHESEAFVLHRHEDSIRQAWWRSHREHLGYALFLPHYRVGLRATLRYGYHAIRAAWEPNPTKGRLRRFRHRVPRIIATTAGRFTGSHQLPHF